jgi:putative ABC transport system permease protein
MINDLRYAFRMLLKSPGFSIIAVVTLALGIGANSAIFSVIDTVLLRPLRFPHPEQLAMIYSRAPQHPDEPRGVHSYPDYVDLRDQNHSFAALSAYTGLSAIWGTGDDSADIPGLAATSDIFDVLGVRPILGRGFSRDDDKIDAARVIVLCYDFWQRRFAGNPQVIGQQATLAGRVYTITGVMPKGWQFPVVRTEGVNFVTPIAPLFSSPGDNLDRRGAHFLPVVGRLKPGITLAQATADLKKIGAQLAEQYPDTDAGRSESVVALHADLVGDVRLALLMLIGAVTFVLVIACANVANLFLARATARQREIAIRAALGASRLRLVRQLLSETLLLALGGGAAALLLAWWSVDLLIAIGPQDLPRLNEISVNGTVVAFTFAIAVLTSIIFGLVPALRASRPQVEQTLKEASRGSTGGVHSHRLRSAFVVSQFALSLVLLVGAGLLIRSFAQLRSVSPGFDPARVVTFWQALPRTRYAQPDQQIQFFDRLLPKLAALPGIEAVGMVSPLPFSGNDRGTTFTIVGQPAPQPGMEPSGSDLTTDGDYFRAMRIPLRSGRTFNSRDGKDAVPVIMINEAFARQYFPGQNALGQRVVVGASPGDPKPAREIIGVVATSKHETLTAPDKPEFYIPFAQAPDRYMDIVLRPSRANPSGIDSMLRHAVHEIDPQQFVPTTKLLEDSLTGTLARPRFNMTLLGLFAGLAMILAAVGIYGVIAYSVTERTREIGIRMALGAQQRQMLTMILRQSLNMAAIGIVIGLGAAFATTRLLGALLYGVGATDLPTYFAVIVVLSAAAFLASLLPARRAMKVDPMVALRYE